jgi:hypothetical protein
MTLEALCEDLPRFATLAAVIALTSRIFRKVEVAFLEVSMTATRKNLIQ